MHRIIIALGVLAVIAAGCGSGGGAAAGDEAGGSTLAVTGTDALTFQPAELTAQAGTVTVELTAGSGVNHTFVVEGVGGDDPVVDAGAGETATGTVDLSSGEYTVYCSVPGHRDAGMHATLRVS